MDDPSSTSAACARSKCFLGTVWAVSLARPTTVAGGSGKRASSGAETERVCSDEASSKAEVRMDEWSACCCCGSRGRERRNPTRTE